MGRHRSPNTTGHHILRGLTLGGALATIGVGAAADAHAGEPDTTNTCTATNSVAAVCLIDNDTAVTDAVDIADVVDVSDLVDDLLGP